MPSLSRILSRAGEAGRAYAAAYQHGGLVEVRKLVREAAYWNLHPRVRRWTAQLPRQQEIDEEFDRAFGLDTAGEVPLSAAGVAPADLARGHGCYRPVWAHVLREAVESVPQKLEPFTFVDYGSGKGKAMFLASDYPFEEIIGIEFARSLHEVAARNIAKYSSARQRCRKLRSEYVDAMAFVPPVRPLVCFFFNPFDAATMATVLDRLRDSARQHPRKVYVVYTNMRNIREQEMVFRARPELLRIAQHPQYLVLEVLP